MQSKRFQEKLNSLKDDIVLAIQDVMIEIDDYVDFEHWGFKDEVGNDISGVDKYYVYFGGDQQEFYSLDDLAPLDGIEILRILEENHSDKFTVKES